MLFYKMSKQKSGGADSSVDVRPAVLSVVLVNAATSEISTAELSHGLSPVLAQQHIKQHIASVDLSGRQGQQVLAGAFLVNNSLSHVVLWDWQSKVCLMVFGSRPVFAELQPMLPSPPLPPWQLSWLPNDDGLADFSRHGAALGAQNTQAQEHKILVQMRLYNNPESAHTVDRAHTATVDVKEEGAGAGSGGKRILSQALAVCVMQQQGVRSATLLIDFSGSSQ
jgi:hypothetical protein